MVQEKPSSMPWAQLLILLETLLCVTLWLVSDYLGSLFTFIIVPIIFGVLLVALISELMERSRVKRSFFVYLVIAGLIPLIIALIMNFLYGGISWQY